MISINDVISYAQKYADKCWFRIENEKDIVDKADDKVVCDIETLVQVMRKKMHCDFECVYNEHVSLLSVIRCKECGTVIFTREDEDYDPSLCCPTCGGYKTWFKYWTAEDIQADTKKQDEIKFLEQMQKEQIEAEERRRRRKGKYDWEIGEFTIRGRKHGVKFELECDNLFRTKLRGLRLRIFWMDRDRANDWFIYTKHCTIPLSYSYFKIMRRITKKRQQNHEEVK